MPRRLLCYPHRQPIVHTPSEYGTDYIISLGCCSCGGIWSQAAFDADLELYKMYRGTDKEEKYYEGVFEVPEQSKTTDDSETKSARWYFATFTRDDKDDDPTQVLKNIKKVIKSKMVSPITWCYGLELTEKGIPHTHAAVYCEKYPEYKKIGKFNLSPTGVQWRYDFQQEKWDVKKYVQKFATKPSDEYLLKYGLTESVIYAENFPAELKVFK